MNRAHKECRRNKELEVHAQQKILGAIKAQTKIQQHQHSQKEKTAEKTPNKIDN